MTCTASPKPDEPDTHVRITWRDMQLDFRACLTAAAGFLTAWAHSHAPTAHATVIDDGVLPARRLPCEELWM